LPAPAVTLLWSLLPLGLAATAVFGLGWFWWEPAVAGVRALLEQGDLLAALFEWLEAMGAPDLRPVLAPMILVALACRRGDGHLLLVAWLMAPAMADRWCGGAFRCCSAARCGRALGGAGLVAGVRAVRAAGAGAERAAVAGAAAGAGAAAADLGLAVLPRAGLRRAGAPCRHRRAPLHPAPPPLAAAAAGLLCGVLARCRRCCGPSWALALVLAPC
jgi:hypothetical protein